MKNKRLNNSYFLLCRFCPGQSVDEFEGVTLDELPQLENLFQVNIMVYALEPLENGKTVAHPVHRSMQHYPSTLYLNLHKNHFSYIKNMKTYSKSFVCSRCGKYWKHVGMLHRHEKTCEAKVRFKFPGGVFSNPKTIFELLEEEGITIPEDLKFFPFHATFDFECMFDKENLPDDSAKVHWEAQHVPLSVSVCSNVPDFTQPKCFVTDGDSKQLVPNLIEYLVQISDHSYVHSCPRSFCDSLCSH